MRYDHKGTEGDKRRADLKSDTMLEDLLSKTPEQVNIFVDSNMSDPAGTKTALKLLFRLVLHLYK